MIAQVAYGNLNRFRLGGPNIFWAGECVFCLTMYFFLLRQAMLTHIHILYTILRPFLSGHFFEMGLTYQRVDVVQYSTLYYPKDLFQQSM